MAALLEPNEPALRDRIEFYPLALYLGDKGTILGGYLKLDRLTDEKDELEVYGVTSIGSQHFVKVSYLRSDVFGSAFKLNAWASHDNWSKSYFGVGNYTTADEMESFLPGRLEFGATLGHALSAKTTASFGFVRRDWHLQGLQADTLIPDDPPRRGINQFLRFEILRDTTDEPIDPFSGGRDRMRVEVSDELLGSEFEFARAELHFARYRPLSENQVLAFRAEIETIVFGEPPVYEMPRLGGRDELRGAPGGRFRGFTSLLFGAEYRRRLSPKLSLAIFGEAGKITDGLDELSLSEFHTTAGLGLRYRVTNSCLLRFDFGFGAGARRLLVDVDHAF